jgi:hypothetical protein
MKLQPLHGVVAIVVVLAIAAILFFGSRGGSGSGTQGSDPGAAALGQRTKTQGCLVHGALPDQECTPGAVLPEATKEKICVAGYSKSVRNVPDAVKDQAYAEYGISSHRAGEYEVDHLVSLELGGANDISNLWPESAEPRPGFHEKDRYENFAHDQVCRGELPLAEAQRRIAGNWQQYWEAAGRP